MRSNLLKSFVAALAGSTLLLVAMFALVAMRPEAATVQAAPAFKAPVLASTPLVTITVDDETKKVGEDFSFVIESSEPTEAMTATVGADVYTAASGNITFTKSFADPGQHDVVATVDLSGTTDTVTQTVTVVVGMAFDPLGQTTKLGSKTSYKVTVTPAYSGTNEEVDFSTGQSVLISNVVSDSAVVTAENTFYAPGTYAVTATYNSGIYNAPIGEATTTITVVDQIKLSLDGPSTGKCSDVVTLTATIDTPITGSVEFKSASAVTAPITNGKAVTTLTLPTVTTDTNVVVTATVKNSLFKTGAKATKTIAVSCNPDVDDLDLVASDTTAPAKGTITFTATIKKGGAVLEQAGEDINFTTTAGTLSKATAETDENGQAVVTLTSDKPTTATVTAQHATVTDAKDSETVQFTGRCEDAKGSCNIDDDHDIEFTDVPSITGELRFPFCIKVEIVTTHPNLDKLPSFFKRHAFFRVIFFNITSGKCNTSEVKNFKFKSKTKIHRKFGFKKSELAAISTTVDVTSTQSSLVHLADETNGLLDTSVTTTGTTGDASAAITTADTFALVTGSNFVYLPSINKTSATTSTVR